MIRVGTPRVRSVKGLGLGLVFLVGIGPAIAAYALVPAAVLTAWAALAVTLVPTCVDLAARVGSRRPRAAADEPRAAQAARLRRHGERLFDLGAGAVLGGVLIGARSFAGAGCGLIVLAAALQVRVVHLRRSPLHVAGLGAYVAAAALAAWESSRHGGAVLVPNAPTTGLAATAATAAGLACLARAATRVLLLLRPPADGPLARLVRRVFLATLSAGALLAVIVCAEPGAPRGAIALAVIPAWAILSMPLVMGLRLLATILGADLTDLGGPRDAPPDADAPPPPLLERAWSLLDVLWSVPLAAWWLA